MRPFTLYAQKSDSCRGERRVYPHPSIEEMAQMIDNVPRNALFMGFGGMSNVGTLTGLAANAGRGIGDPERRARLRPV